MDVYFVSRDRLNVYITGPELAERHIDLYKLFSDSRSFQTELKEMLESVGENAHFPIQNTPLEIELFPVAEGDLLISLLRCRQERYQAIFSDAESLIACCNALSPFPGKSRLYLYDGKYYLCLTTAEQDKTNCLLKEFADAIPTTLVSEAVLSEYGKLICNENCIDLFTKQFKV